MKGNMKKNNIYTASFLETFSFLSKFRNDNAYVIGITVPIVMTSIIKIKTIICNISTFNSLS